MFSGLIRPCAVVLLSVVAALLLIGSVGALQVPPTPTDVPVVDQTNTLDDAQKAELAKVIAEQREQTGNQIAVLMIPSLEGDSLEEYSIRVAREWGIGGKERDNGVLLLVVKDDRKVRIEVGFGLEGALTDARSGQIIRNRITPQFSQDNYYLGIKSGVEGIALATEGEADPAVQTEQSGFSWASAPWEIILFLLFFIPTWLASILARTKSWWAGGVLGAIIGIVIALFVGFALTGLLAIAILTIVGLLFDRAVSKNYQRNVANGSLPSWWAGGTHLGGGPRGGGFGGFGGGGFGGGGASGSW